MSWVNDHMQSQQYAFQAEIALKQGNTEAAVEYYRLAAQLETSALAVLDAQKVRTFAITAVSAASLWYKAGNLRQVELIAYQGLTHETLPAFAVKELQLLLQAVWNEKAREQSGIEFTQGEVFVSVSGGEVVTGGAPLELILRKVDEVSRLFYRTVEMLLDYPLRRRGEPSQEIKEQFRPWLFQAPAGSYQFAVRVERPKQMSLFPEHRPQVETITQTFLGIVQASAYSPEEELPKVVTKQEYRETFLKLTRNLTPTGKTFGQMEIKSPTSVDNPVVLVPASRDTINKALKTGFSPSNKGEAQGETQFRGVLRGLQLNHDWLDIDTFDTDKKTIRVLEAQDAIDDVIGPMVNHRVIVDVVVRKGKYYYRDIQPEE